MVGYDYKIHLYIKLSCCQYEGLYPFENYLTDKIWSELLSFILTAWHRLHDIWNLPHFLSNRLSLRLTNFSFLQIIAIIKCNGLLKLIIHDCVMKSTIHLNEKCIWNSTCRKDDIKRWPMWDIWYYLTISRK